MRDVNAQALYTLSYLAPTDGGNHAVDQNGNRNIGFYTLGLEADIDINANISRLQLGCGGVNGADGCDVDIQNFSLGCIANSTGTCITLHPTGNQKAGAVPDGSPVNETQQTQMKNLTLNNPFVEFAIKNPQSAALREVVGFRLGARGVEGPMSFGTLNSFSGYLTGTAELFARGETDVAATCIAPALCPDANGRSTFKTGANDPYLGLDNTSVTIDLTVLNVGVKAVAQLKNVTVDYGEQTRAGSEKLGAIVNGTRLTQAAIAGLRLGDLADDVVDDLDLNQGIAAIQVCVLLGCPTAANLTISNWPDGVKGALLDILRPQVNTYVKQQLATGLNGTTVNGGTPQTVAANTNSLNQFILPYNLSNVHQLQVNSNSFNIALSAFDLRYPGYVTAVNRGWSLYMPEAFNLVIDDPLSTLVKNIANLPDARSGNITGLEAPYRNCWGNLTYC